MGCDRCGREAILFQPYSGLRLCREHFELDLAAKAKRAIRAHGWIRTGDRVAVALSGGPGSSSLLHLLAHHFGMRPDLSLVAVTLDEGDGSGTDLRRVERIAGELGIEWEATTRADGFGGMPDMVPAPMAGGSFPSSHGPLRNPALASLAGRLGATRLALGTGLDDVARAVLARVLGGDAPLLLRFPEPSCGGIPVIRPLLRIPEAELALYAELNVPGYIRARRVHPPGLMEGEAARILEEFTRRHPSTPFSLVSLGEALSGRDGAGGRALGPHDRWGEDCPVRGPRDRVSGHG